jgi:Flp pilus assembly protein TadG
VPLCRSRQRGQAVVEFGLIALLFTLLMFAVVDFGLLLNGWLTVASDTQQLARDAAVGAYTGCTPWPSCRSQLNAKANSFPIPGVTADSPTFTGYCCTPTSALVLTVIYYNQCTPGAGVCPPVNPTQLDNRYSTGSPPQLGTCSAPCPHPARPSPPGTTTCPPGPNSCPGDTVVVILRAAGAQIITPLVRPFFRDPTWCPDTGAQHCYVSLSNTVSMRFDGGQF